MKFVFTQNIKSQSKYKVQNFINFFVEEIDKRKSSISHTIFFNHYFKTMIFLQVYKPHKMMHQMDLNTLRPQNIVVTSTIFLHLVFWVMYEDHILHYFCLFK